MAKSIVVTVIGLAIALLALLVVIAGAVMLANVPLYPDELAAVYAGFGLLAFGVGVELLGIVLALSRRKD
jgi:hypothetical protein